MTIQHIDFAVTIPADQNPCRFDLVFTELGDNTVTTFTAGQQISHGILQHTISSPWRTLTSIPDGTVIAESGLDRFSPALCVALGP